MNGVMNEQLHGRSKRVALGVTVAPHTATCGDLEAEEGAIL
jgi:hypothetical protein